MDKDKQEQMLRHLRGASRFAARKENELKKKARGPGASRGRRAREEDDWLEDLEELGVPSTRAGRAARAPSGRPRPAELALLEPEDCAARVVAVYGAQLGILGDEGLVRVPAPLGAALACGDRVALERHAEHWQLVGVAERSSELMRPDANGRGRRQALAANVDLGLVMLPARRVSAGFALRVRLALHAGGVETGIVVHKSDLMNSEARASAARVLEPLAADGIGWRFTSLVSGEGLAELASELGGRTTVLIGQSGCGKSSLTNALIPDAERAVGAVRESDGRGRHTSTSASLVALPGGGFLVDTPGVRSYAVEDTDPRVLLASFARLAPHSESCPKGCMHLEAEACAVRAAAAADPELARVWDLFTRLCRRE